MGIAVVTLVGAAYLATAARDIVVGDTPELAAVALTLGVAHPPGYPLLTVLGYLFSLMPLGPEPFRLNLLPVVAHTATVGVVYLTSLKLTGHGLASAAAALALAFNPLFWSWSLVLETFPLNDLLAATMVYLLILWHERTSAEDTGTGTGRRDRRRPHPSPRRTRRYLRQSPLRWERGGGLLVGASLVAGLGMANHQTIALLGPAVLYLVWRQRRGLFARPRVIAACAAAFVLGLLPYAYIPWAAGHGAFWNWLGVASAADFMGLVTRAAYGPGQLVIPELAGGSGGDRLGALVASLTPLQIGLIAAGAIGAYLWARWYFWFMALALGLAGPGFALYANIDLSRPYLGWVFERFFLLPLTVAAPLAAVGVVVVGSGLASAVGRSRLRVRGSRLLAAVGPSAIGVAAVGIVLATVAISYGSMDRSANRIARTFAEDVLATIEPGGVLLASGDEIVGPVAYLHAVEGQRADIALVVAPLLTEPWYVRQLRERYPHLEVPFARLDPQGGRLVQLVDANRGRSIWLVGTAPDEGTVARSYAFRARGLARTVETGDVAVDEMAGDNERLLALYRPPSLREVEARTFERSIVSLYALGPARVGEAYERAGRGEEAARWYRRALDIDPELERARRGLARVGL